MKSPLRIASGQGFWGDWLEAPIRQVESGPIDYLVLDYLAEVTMSILQKLKARDPSQGYARDFVDLAVRLLPQLIDKDIKIVSNAGGVNPRACAEAVIAAARAGGIKGAKVAVVLGDDIFERLDEMLSRGVPFNDMDSGAPISAVRDRILSANVYLGAFPLVEALQTGAQIVIAGRSTDTALTLAPMVHEFGWGAKDWDRLAAGTIAGHILECGAQASGGNCQLDWQSIPDFANIGFPIAEASPDGSFVVTKHAGTGGRVSLGTVKEQLVYELGDPANYITPDCTADFTSIQLEAAGPDRVRVSGIQGGPRPPTLKTSVTYSAGWKAVGTLVYSWPDAVAKARAADGIVRQRLADLGLAFDEIHTELLGVNACHAGVAAANPDPPEVQLRIGARGRDRHAVDRFTRELIPLILTGPPTGTGFGEGRPPVREVVAYWSSLLPREEIRTSIETFTL
ncbi:MAG TPA: acyclic terpene utilization AtuA family protein [Bryobacterales bacterium]|nr:acyclic terpene utilization AtuA family protein [Bryobacterales bacterium]